MLMKILKFWVFDDMVKTNSKKNILGKLNKKNVDKYKKFRDIYFIGLYVLQI